MVRSNIHDTKQVNDDIFGILQDDNTIIIIIIVTNEVQKLR